MSRKIIQTTSILNVNDLLRFLQGIDEASPQTIYIEGDEGSPFVYANLIRETLTDGSHTFNVTISARHSNYPGP